VQPSTGSGTELFVSLPACKYCGRIRFFFPLSPVLIISFHSATLLYFRYFLTAIQNSTVYKNLNVKTNWYSFSCKRVTDLRVFLTAGPALAVTSTFRPTGSDTRLLNLSFYLILVNLPFKTNGRITTIMVNLPFKPKTVRDFQSRLSPRIRIYIRNRFSPWISGPRGTVWRKNQMSKISWDCPFNTIVGRNVTHNAFNWKNYLPSTRYTVFE
jgi:hypothetical protein